MTSTYSDIVRLRGGKPAYNIEEEQGDEWTSFIPNEQFNGVLRTVIKAVRGNDIDNHKSFWINGTYGTGKSHAAAVIAHILSDPVEEIKDWVDYEFKGSKYVVIREAIYKLREKKRLLPIKIYGLRGMSAVVDLALVVQKDVMGALKTHGIEISVQTDYESLIATIEKSREVWTTIIDNNLGLQSIAPTPEKLINLLKTQNINAYHRAVDTLKEQNLSASLQLENLSKWLIEVQNAVTEQTEYNGILILWDEFTDVMNAFGVAILKEIQAVAEKFMNAENNSFIFLVSHPSAFNSISQEEVKQTDGRYHRMSYNMEAVSAFKIMSRKFEVVNQEQYDNLRSHYYGGICDVIQMYTASAVDQQATIDDLRNLFPMHPGTANLATYYATVIGSSSRSVFEFLGQNDAIREFMNSEEHFLKRHTITADYLWDFVLKIFQEDITNYGAVTERYNSYQNAVAHHSESDGGASMAIFKAILLLNAFNNISGEENRSLVTPSEANIKALFAGTQYQGAVDDVLRWLNAESIIQRAPGEEGLYSVQFSALPAKEIEDKKKEMCNVHFRYTSQVVTYGDEAANGVSKKFAPKVIRPYAYGFFSDEGNDSALASKIKNGKKAAKSSNLYFAFLVARNLDEKSALTHFVEKMTILQETDKELQNIFFILVDEVFTDKDYERFIEYQANLACASSHGFVDQMTTHRKHASDLVKDYIARVGRGNATVYINDQSFPISMKHFSSDINDKLSPVIFFYAPESLEILRKKAPQTFWANKTSKEIVRRVLFSQTKSEIWDGMAQGAPIRFLLQDSIDDNLEWKSDVTESHPLRAIFNFVQKKIKDANKTVPFNFAEKFEELTRPPFGLYNSFAAMAAMAFALRPWIGKIFDQMGKPRDANNLVEYIAELFKVWDSGKASNKLTFKFQTPEEGKLCKSLTDLFHLKNPTAGYTDISSLKDARFAITGQFVEKKGFPLWSLKYTPDDVVEQLPGEVKLTDDIKTLIDNIVKICSPGELRNPALLRNTLDLISANRNEVSTLVKMAETYRAGFLTYLRSIENVNLQDAEIEDALTYIRHTLHSTLGYWTENEVRDALKDWKLSKMPSGTKPLPAPFTTPAQTSTNVQAPITTQNAPNPILTDNEFEEKREEALLKLKGENSIDRLKEILECLCGDDNIEVIEYINSFL